MDLRSAHVLVVDDHQPMREILKSLLFGLGARQVSEASSVIAALEHLMFNAVHLVLTDHDMGGATGVELVRAIRRQPQGKNRAVPIVMVSGRAQPAVILAARDAGVNEFLVKPLTASGLAQKIASALADPRPFVVTQAYVGPERRRRDAGPPRPRAPQVRRPHRLIGGGRPTCMGRLTRGSRLPRGATLARRSAVQVCGRRRRRPAVLAQRRPRPLADFSEKCRKPTDRRLRPVVCSPHRWKGFFTGRQRLRDRTCSRLASGSVTMPLYTLYPGRADGSSISFSAVELADDSCARRSAEALLRQHDSAVEVVIWQEERRVGAVARHVELAG